MSDFSNIQEDINKTINEIKDILKSYLNYEKIEREIKKEFKENKLNDLKKNIEEISNEIIMWDKNNSKEGYKFLNNIKAEIQIIESNFIDLKKKIKDREILLGNQFNDQRNMIEDNSQLLNKKGNLINELSKEVNFAKETGTDILSNLNDQRDKLGHINEELSRLESNIDTGDTLLEEMICRGKRRTIFLWFLIIVLIICMFLFLYFLFI